MRWLEASPRQPLLRTGSHRRRNRATGASTPGGMDHPAEVLLAITNTPACSHPLFESELSRECLNNIRRECAHQLLHFDTEENACRNYICSHPQASEISMWASSDSWVTSTRLGDAGPTASGSTS